MAPGVGIFGSGGHLRDGDLVITVCNLAFGELAEAAAVLVIPDPVPAGDPGSFDAALAQLSDRVGWLAPRLVVLSWPGGLAAVMRWRA